MNFNCNCPEPLQKSHCSLRVLHQTLTTTLIEMTIAQFIAECALNNFKQQRLSYNKICLTCKTIPAVKLWQIALYDGNKVIFSYSIFIRYLTLVFSLSTIPSYHRLFTLNKTPYLDLMSGQSREVVILAGTWDCFCGIVQGRNFRQTTATSEIKLHFQLHLLATTFHHSQSTERKLPGQDHPYPSENISAALAVLLDKQYFQEVK